MLIPSPLIQDALPALENLEILCLGGNILQSIDVGPRKFPKLTRLFVDSKFEEFAMEQNPNLVVVNGKLCSVHRQFSEIRRQL